MTVEWKSDFEKRLVVPVPGHASETANRLRAELIECARAEVQVGEGTASAAVLDCYSHTLAFPYN